MDPNHHWNYNQYSRLAPGSLSTPHSAFPILDQAGLSSSLGLTHSLQPHAPLPQRALGTLPAVNYAAAHHPLHSSAMSQIIESISPLAGGFSPQSLHKAGMSLGQNPLVFESVRPDQQIPASSARFSPASSAVFSSSAKSSLFEEHKDPPHSYSSPSVAAPSPALDSSGKGWGLANFMPPPPSANPFGAISSVDMTSPVPMSSASHRSSQPPPAHSSASRHSAIQRNPFSAEGMVVPEISSRSGGRSQVGVSSSAAAAAASSSQALYNMMGLMRQHGHHHPTPTPTPPQVGHAHMDFHGLPQHEIEDLSSGSASQQSQLYYSLSTTSYSTPAPTNTPTTSFVTSHLSAADMNYDPVSPATPLSETPQPGETAFPTTVSFADLNAIGAGSQLPHAGVKSRGGSVHSGPPSLAMSQPEVKEVAPHLRSLILPQAGGAQRGSRGSKSQQLSRGGGSVHSPHQHSPISVGSPQAPMSSMGSPQNVMPSSTVKAVAPPVQAMADSSTATKPKRSRSRKKPKAEILKTVAPPPPAPQPHPAPPQSPFGSPQPPGFLSSSQAFSGQAAASFQTSTTTSRSVPQPFAPPPAAQHQDSTAQQLLQAQFSVSSPAAAQGILRLRGSLGSDGLGGEGAGYQVLSSVGTNQVSPISDQSPRPHQQQPQQTVEQQAPTLISISNSGRVNSSPLKAGGGGGGGEGMLSAGYHDDPGGGGASDLIPQQGGQFDLQAFSSQPYMEQLVSGQPVRLIPGNVYTEAMQVAGGMTAIYPPPFASYPTADGGSTIDEAAFSSLFDSSSGAKVDGGGGAGGMVEGVGMEVEPTTAATQPPPPKPSATCTNPVDEDDELCNFARPPPELADKDSPRASLRPPPPHHGNSSAPGAGGLAQQVEKPPEIKLHAPANKSSPGFQDSFLSFLMGKKQETLSSVTTATIGDKPQLPKYIPEPRRPAPAPRPSDPATSSTPVSFSEDEEDPNVGTAVKNALSALGNDSDSYDSDVQETGYSVQRTKDLTVKITLQNTLRKQHRARGKPSRRGIAGRGRGDAAKAKSSREPTPPPPRESIGRRAKDMAKEKTKKKRKYRDSGSSEDEESEEELKVKGRPAGSGSEYDSDKDPVWTPFEEQEPKRPVGFTYDPSAMLEPKHKKGKKSKRSHRSRSHRHSGEFSRDMAVAMPTQSAEVVSPLKLSANGSSQPVDTQLAEEPADLADDKNFQVGHFLLEKKDLHNYESYPIWRLEQGRMMRKFEMVIDNGRVHHKAVSTYSSWVPSMQAGYVPIRVLVLTGKPQAEVVEVMEEFRPKPPADGSLEVQYEDDPLVDHFNVYLQIFLSQSLEASFLAAIRKSHEYFYLVPLEKIDKMIDHKLEQIDKIVQWKPKFRECMRSRPQMREINRPNLKQSCQACEHSSPPTIKSVLFHGAAYDRFLLTDLPEADASSQEFLVGKTAAPFVTQYHNLHHFKYTLYQRCRAKVHMVRESNRSQNIREESILDQCLQNRGWVLKIFEDFKSLLER